MSKYNIELITAAQAKDTADKLTAAGIGGGVVKIFDFQNPLEGGEGSIAGATVDASDPTAKLYALDFANGVKGANAGLLMAEINNNPVRWVAMIQADIDRAAREKPDPDN